MYFYICICWQIFTTMKTVFVNGQNVFPQTMAWKKRSAKNTIFACGHLSRPHAKRINHEKNKNSKNWKIYPPPVRRRPPVLILQPSLSFSSRRAVDRRRRRRADPAGGSPPADRAGRQPADLAREGHRRSPPARRICAGGIANSWPPALQRSPLPALPHRPRCPPLLAVNAAAAPAPGAFLSASPPVIEVREERKRKAFVSC